MQQNGRIDSINPTQQSENIHQRIIFNLMEKVGSQGLYQKISLVAWCFCGYLCGAALLSVAFILYQDPYECPDYITQNCKTYVCNLDPEERRAFLPQITIHSIINKYGDYRCSPQQNLVSIIVLLMYLGLIASQLIMALVGDIVGRKSLLLFGFLTQITGLLITIFSSSLALSTAGLFLMMLGAELAYSLSFLFIIETVTQELRQKYQVCVHISFGFGQTANVGLYYWLKNWKPVHIYFYLIPALLGVIIVIFFVVDTPICLVKHYEPIQALQRFSWIAQINGIQNSLLQVDQIAEVKQRENLRQNQESKSSKFTILDLFRYSSLRWITILMVIIRLCVQFLYYVPNFMMGEFQLSIYINGLALGISSLVGFIVAYFIISDVKRKTFGIISFTTIFICSFTLIFFWKPKSDGEALPLSTNIAILVVLIIINLLISIEFSFLEVYTTELFPSQVRVIAFGLIVVLGASGVSASEFIVNASINGGFSVMIIFSILAFTSIIASLFLPQSLGIPPPDIIEQLSNLKGVSQRQTKMEKNPAELEVLQSQRELVQKKSSQAVRT